MFAMHITCLVLFLLDNSFLQYREDAVPTSQETWDKTVFVEKSYYGFYCWPRFGEYV